MILCSNHKRNTNYLDSVRIKIGLPFDTPFLFPWVLTKKRGYLCFWPVSIRLITNPRVAEEMIRFHDLCKDEKLLKQVDQEVYDLLRENLHDQGRVMTYLLDLTGTRHGGANFFCWWNTLSGEQSLSIMRIYLAVVERRREDPSFRLTLPADY